MNAAVNTVAGEPGALPRPATDKPTFDARRLGKQLVLGAASIAAVVALAVYGAHWWSQGRFMLSTDDAYVGGDVTVMSSRVSGYIASVAVTDNQFVHAGDLLVTLDGGDYRAALAKADGAVAAQQALIANLQATRHLQDAVIAQARAGVNSAEADRVRAHDDQVRYAGLVSRSLVSLQSSQKADADSKQADANRQKADAELVATQTQIEVIDSQKRQAEAGLAQALAERDIARLNLGYTELRAPIDGVVGNRRARTGAYAAAGTQLLSVVPAHGLWVDANLKEGQLERVRAGQPATVEADVLPGHVFHGHVASVAPATGAQFSVLPTENATGNFTKIVQRVPVRILLDEHDRDVALLRPGLSVIAKVDSRTAE